jgi:MFS family permease
MPPEAHDPYAALAHRDYRLLLGSGFLGSMCQTMLAVAVGWELYERTESAGALGLAGLTGFMPVLFLSLPAGQAADHFSRKGIFEAAQVGVVLAALGLALLSMMQGPIPLIYACLFLVGVCRAFSAPARWALVSEVVPLEHLQNAVTWNSTAWHVAAVAGPALGGLAVAQGGHAVLAYLLAAGFAAAGALLFLPARCRPIPRQAEPFTLTSLMAGVRFVWRTDLLLAAITLDLFAVLLGGATALLPIYARDILDVGPRGLGWLRAAPAIGAFAMALVLAHLPPFRRAGLALVWAVAGFGAATIAFGLSTDPALSFVMLALTGALDNISVVVRHTMVQVLTPNEMRGRVSAVNFVFISSSNELGDFESGVTAQLFGTVVSVVAGGVGTLLVVLLVALRWPRLLRLGSLRLHAGTGLPDENALAPEEASPAPSAGFAQKREPES